MNDLILPAEVTAIASQCHFLAEARRAEIVEHLRAMPPARQSATLALMVTWNNDEGRFARVLLGKETVARGESPDNKKLNAPETK